MSINNDHDHNGVRVVKHMQNNHLKWCPCGNHSKDVNVVKHMQSNHLKRCECGKTRAQNGVSVAPHMPNSHS